MKIPKQSPQTAQPGISLIEIGMAMLFISLALVPLVQMVGGAKGDDGSNAARVTGNRSKELLMANALIERGLARDFSVLGCDGSTPTMPAGSTPVSYAVCTNNDYSTPMYYRWTVRNVGAGVGMPTGNQLYQAVLNVYSDAQASDLRLTLPTYFFNNTSGWNPPVQNNGIVIVLDTSGSMDDANGSLNSSSTSGSWPGVASPYLKYRYYDPTYPAFVPPGTALDLANNGQLDIVSAQNNNIASTQWDDRYLQNSVLGMSNCTSTAAYNSAVWSTYFRLSNDTQRNSVRELCRTKVNTADWEHVMNDQMSRIEAARSSLLSLLMDIESDASLYQNMKMGFITFNSNVQTRVTPESVDANNRFPTMRRQLSWINRSGPGLIKAENMTNLYGGVEAGAQMIFNEPNLDNRIIFVVGDGQPTVGSTGHAAFRSLADSIANGTFAGANGNTATIFSLGVVEDQATIEPYLKTDLADRTPGGRFFYAQNVADLRPVFDQIKYQIQKVILISRANRYGIEVE